MPAEQGLEVGEEAPDFTAPLVWPDGDTEDRALSTLVADRPVLLCFYTFDFSPDCIDEWCAFRDFEWFASGERVQVVGVSKSGPGLHRRFIDRFDLGFPLYSDRDLVASDAFDVTYRFLKVARRSRRSCFLVDEDMTVRYRWLADHWFDPTVDTPPLDELRDGIAEVVGEPTGDTFGFS